MFTCAAALRTVLAGKVHGENRPIPAWIMCGTEPQLVEARLRRGHEPVLLKGLSSSGIHEQLLSQL